MPPVRQTAKVVIHGEVPQLRRRRHVSAPRHEQPMSEPEVTASDLASLPPAARRMVLRMSRGNLYRLRRAADGGIIVL